jgi:hypothetical protein
MQGNSGAEMLELNAKRFAGLGVGHVPKFHTMTRVRAPRNAPQIIGRNYRRIVESGESGEGERPGAHVAIAICARRFIYKVNSVADLTDTELGKTVLFIFSRQKRAPDLCRRPHFHGAAQKPIGKEKTRKKAMGFGRHSAGRRNSGVRRVDNYCVTYATVG